MRILVIALVHLSVAHTCVDGKRFGRFLRDKVDYRTGGTRAVQRTAGSFYNLDTVDGVQVETLVVEIPGHVARHALAVHQEQHVAGVEPLHGDFVSEAHLLDIQTGSFLLQCLLQVAVSGFDQLLAAQDLRRNGRHLDGSRCTRTGDDYLVQSQMILFQIDGLLGFGRFYLSCCRNKTDIGYFVIIRFLGGDFQFRQPVHIRDAPLQVLQRFVIGIDHSGRDDRLFRPFLQNFELYFTLCLGIHTCQ